MFRSMITRATVSRAMGRRFNLGVLVVLLALGLSAWVGAEPNPNGHVGNSVGDGLVPKVVPSQAWKPEDVESSGAAAPSNPPGTVEMAARGPLTPRDAERVSVFVFLDPAVEQGHTASSPSMCRSSLKDFSRRCGAHIKYEYEVLPNVVNLRNITRKDLDELRRQPGVLNVVEDAVYQINLQDSLPLIHGLQSELSAAGYSVDGTGIRACIVDTGIDTDHTMYADRIDLAAGYDFFNDDPNPEDDHGHGTHVAGIVGGRATTVGSSCSGPRPFQGVAPNVTLIGVKVCSSTGSCPASDIVAGIGHCASANLPGGRAHVMNISLGGAVYASACDSEPTALAVNSAVAAGVFVSVAAGNNNSNGGLSSPACASQSFAVGAAYDRAYPNCEHPEQSSFTFCFQRNLFGQCISSCTDNLPQADTRACFSNRSINLDVVAPGCITFSADEAAGGNSIVGLCGTSMASPHVAGLAALILDHQPSLTPAEVAQVIRAGAVDRGPAGFDTAYGHGRIDVRNSLMLLPPPCTEESDCDDGLFCNGAETCSNGSCLPGEVPCSGQFCREVDQDCVACLVDAHCQDGSFCNGVETCRLDGTCEPSIEPMVCDDEIPCTVDSCNDVAGRCDYAANHAACGDAIFCNGAERCDMALGCIAGPPACGAAECDEDNDVCLSNPSVWMVFKDPATVPGVGTVDNEDIVAYDLLSGTWSMIFDGSDVGLASYAIDGLAVLPSGNILMSFVNGGIIPGIVGVPGGLTLVDDSDIVEFIPNALGASTSGTFSFYFDGSNVGLTLNSEDIDAIGFSGDGRLLISTAGAVAANGVSGADTDIFLFNATGLGASTGGTFEYFLDGGDVNLADYSSEDIDGFSWTPAGTLILTTIGNASVPGVVANNEDILEFTPSQLGTTTSGTYTLRLDLTTLGILAGEDVADIEWVE